MAEAASQKAAGETALLAALDQKAGIEHFPLLLGETWNAVAIVDPLDRVIYINSAFTRMFGYVATDILGKAITRVFGVGRRGILDKYHEAIRNGVACCSEEIVFGKFGQRLWSSITANPVRDGNGDHAVTVCVFTDITDTKMREVLQNRAVDAMARDVSSAEVLDMICREVESIIPEAIVVVNGLDESGRLYPIAAPSLPDSCRQAIRGLSQSDAGSPSWRALEHGVEVVEMDMDASDLAPPRLQPLLDIGVHACWATPIMGSHGGARGTVTYYYFDRRAPDEFQKSLSKILVNLCALALDRKRIRDEMRQLNFYDKLTGLLNRNLLLANGDKVLARNAQAGRDVPMAVFCLNIDRFRQVNSSLGYEAGNELLTLVAERLSMRRFSDALIGRVGADEFALVLPGCDEARAVVVATQILADISTPCRIAGVDLIPSASIGIALYPENSNGMEELLNSANAALALAKTSGDNHYAFYSSEANARAKRSLSLESRLRKAVENKELSLLYQPQISFQTGRIHGVEALARWESDEFGPISPESFIPLAEAAGIIDMISDWVVGTVCRQLADWKKRGVNIPAAAVNLSAPNFRNPVLVERLRSHLKANDIDPRQLVLELTESVFLDDNPVTMESLARIQSMGLRLSLDDFGTGYSGLSYLRNIPITEIKLDRSFVRDLESDPASRRLSQAIMRLGENLGLTVVVEGVETQQQFTLLKNQGYQILQGYFISRPLTPQALEEWLAENNIQPEGATQSKRRGATTRRLNDASSIS